MLPMLRMPGPMLRMSVLWTKLPMCCPCCPCPCCGPSCRCCWPFPSMLTMPSMAGHVAAVSVHAAHAVHVVAVSVHEVAAAVHEVAVHEVAVPVHAVAVHVVAVSVQAVAETIGVAGAAILRGLGDKQTTPYLWGRGGGRAGDWWDSICTNPCPGPALPARNSWVHFSGLRVLPPLLVPVAARTARPAASPSRRAARAQEACEASIAVGRHPVEMAPSAVQRATGTGPIVIAVVCRHGRPN